MTEMTQAPPTDGEQSTTDQAKEKVQEAAGQVQQQVGEKAQQVRGKATQQITQQLDSRTTHAGEQVTATADALRRVSGMLVSEGKATPAQYTDRAAEPMERLGRYLTDADGERILRDAEQFARQRPWIAVVGGATLGFLVARFIKASGQQNGAAMQMERHGQMQMDSYGQPALPAASGGQTGGIDVDARR